MIGWDGNGSPTEEWPGGLFATPRNVSAALQPLRDLIGPVLEAMGWDGAYVLPAGVEVEILGPKKERPESPEYDAWVREMRSAGREILELEEAGILPRLPDRDWDRRDDEEPEDLPCPHANRVDLGPEGQWGCVDCGHSTVPPGVPVFSMRVTA